MYREEWKRQPEKILTIGRLGPSARTAPLVRALFSGLWPSLWLGPSTHARIHILGDFHSWKKHAWASALVWKLPPDCFKAEEFRVINYESMIGPSALPGAWALGFTFPHLSRPLCSRTSWNFIAADMLRPSALAGAPALTIACHLPPNSCTSEEL